jgi:hypothetical protein
MMRQRRRRRSVGNLALAEMARPRQGEWQTGSASRRGCHSSTGSLVILQTPTGSGGPLWQLAVWTEAAAGACRLKDSQLCLAVRARSHSRSSCRRFCHQRYRTAAVAFCGFVRQRLGRCEDLTSRSLCPRLRRSPSIAGRTLALSQSCPPYKTPEFRASLSQESSLGHAVSSQDAVGTASVESPLNKGSTQIAMRSIALARPDRRAGNGRAIMRWLAGLPRGVLCRLALHQRVRIETSDPTFTREVCKHCRDEVCDVDEVD